ncbi:Glyoxylate reductase [Lasiodiplodia theobromae]|uniref:Glyoxylate reductase n=1 Tax=Lasiodiplodia theobromae TaxID=45133 RepID=UPI0015C37736|nr:Glyoxylate reductase [Lasiodiplodia theobromae]KAF4545974.1 Glyoxylate reductase [Lasiodiplodia theobromae]
MTSQDLLLILMPFTPDPNWVESLRKTSPGLRVKSYKVDMYANKIPADIPAETWQEVTILFTWKSFPTRELAPNIKYVQLLSAGCNQILDLPLFRDTDISFCTSNGLHPPQIAEWVFATFLAFQHHIPEYLENQRMAKWVDPVSDDDTEDAVGLRVGILGYGCVGRQCARVAKAFGMDVYAYTLHERPTPESRKDDSFIEPGLGDPNGEFPSKWFFGPDQLNDFLASDLDLLVISLPGTETTRRMIAREQFKLLSKKRTYVSNVGRGSIVDTDDLVDALDQGLIRGAAIDVTEPEPLPADHKLWKCKNLILTPHCSGNSNHYYERICKILAYNLARRSRGEPLINEVDRSLGY